MAAVRAAAAVALLALAVAAEAAGDPPKPAGPRLEFTPPAPGSYTLQRIQRAPDGMVQGADGRQRPLARLTTGKITLLSFFYTYCSDAFGCPFAYETLATLREQLLAEPALAQRVRFVNISFDPEHDSAVQLRAYGGRFEADPRLEWRFVRSPSVPALLPLLDGFGQDVSVETDERGRPTRTRYHTLKMFLIDAGGQVREIYALDYLHPAMMLADIRTLALEAAR